MSEETIVPAEDSTQPVEETAVEQTIVEGTESTEEVVETTPESKEEPVVEDKPAEERPVWTMPVSKAQEEKKRAVEKAKLEAAKEMATMRKEYEQKLASASDPSKADYDKRLAEVATEHGLAPEAAKALLDVFKESVVVPDMSKYDKIVKDQEIGAAKLKVSQEFDEKVLPLIQKDFPAATQAHINEVKARISELAFSEGYNTYHLQDIYRVKQGDFVFKNGMGAEPSGGHSTDMLDLDKVLSVEDESALAKNNPEAFKKYVEHQAAIGSIWTK